MTQPRYTDEQIERHAARIASDGIVTDEDLADAAAMLRQLQAERRAAEKEVVIDHLNQMHAMVAQMCETLGLKRDEVPCDAWALNDAIVRTIAELADLRAYHQRREQEDENVANGMPRDWHRPEYQEKEWHVEVSLGGERLILLGCDGECSGKDDLDMGVLRWAVDALIGFAGFKFTPVDASTLTEAEARAWATRAALWGVIIGQCAEQHNDDTKTESSEFVAARVAEAHEALDAEMDTPEDHAMADAAVERARKEQPT